MSPKELATKVVDEMMKEDAYSQWLGIKRIKDDAGLSYVKMTIRPEMLNGFGICHGAITFALADSALAFASNSHGRKAVSIETSISHIKQLKAGEVVIAEAEEESLTNKIGIYKVTVKRASDKEVVALFKGTVYRTSRHWEV